MRISKLQWTILTLGLVSGLAVWLGTPESRRKPDKYAKPVIQLQEQQPAVRSDLSRRTSRNSRAVSASKMSDDELRRILGISELAWSGKLGQLARLLEDGSYGEARSFLDRWLDTDFEGALLALPSMAEFRYRFGDDFPAETFVQHLRRLDGIDRMEILGLLGYGNLAVRLITAQVMKDWWEQSADSMLNWIQTTPSFTDYNLLQEFLSAADTRDGNLSKLAFTFYSLEAADPRRLRFFDQILEQWMNKDFHGALEFMNIALALADKETVTKSYDPNNGSPADFAVPDQTIARFAFAFADDGKMAVALNWLGRITDAASREVYVRDLSFKVVSDGDRSTFNHWIKANPIQAEDIRLQIQNNLRSGGG